MVLLRRASLRHLLGHPWQIGLSLLGIALGVAVMVAIDLANESAQRAFALSTEAIVGRATHQIIGGPVGLAEDVYRAVRVDHGVRLAAPIVEGDVALPGHSGWVLHVLGVDPFAEGPFRPYLGQHSLDSPTSLRSLLSSPATGLMFEETAHALDVEPGDTLTVRVGAEHKTIRLVGYLRTRDGIDRRAAQQLLIVDIATAQELLGLTGRLSRIDLIVPPDELAAGHLRSLRAALPAGSELLRSETRSTAVLQMTRAFRVNLTALSLLALMVGMFLIYNTMTFSVVQRRGMIAIWRMLGVTRGQVFSVVIGEAIVIGLIGTAAGVVLGVLLAQGLIGRVTQTITDLYFVLSVREVAVAPLVLIKGTLIGLAATVAAAVVPAVEATRSGPRVQLLRSSLETRARHAVSLAALSGVVMLAAGAGLLLVPGDHLLLSFGGLFVVLVGCVLLTPAGTLMIMSGLQPLLGLAFGGVGRLCVRGVVAALSRTATAIAALMIAVAVAVGVGIMVASFRHTVGQWLTQSLHADIYISAPSLVARRSDSVLEPALIERLRTTPGIAVTNTYRGTTLEGPDGPVQLVALALAPRSYEAFRFLTGTPAEIWPAFQDGGAVIISESYAYRAGLTADVTLSLRTDRGPRKFRVAGVFADYGSDQGVVMMSRQTYDTHWEDAAVSSLGLYAEPGVALPDLIERLRRRVDPGQDILIRSNRSLRKTSLEIFDRTFAITAVLHLLALVVSFIGVLSALMALQLERTHELGVLRAVGMTPGQLWRLMTGQTALMGLVAGVFAIPVGLLLAGILVFVINRRSFGWTLELQIPPEVVLQAVLLALAAALLAGVYPALRMSRISPAVALREE